MMKLDKRSILLVILPLFSLLMIRNAGAKGNEADSYSFPDIFKFHKSIEKKWDYIVLHHSATDSGTAGAFDRYHKEHFKDPWGLEYHFVVLNGKGRGSADGLVEIGRRWYYQVLGNHLFRPEKAKNSIAICLVGNFDKKNTLTEKQLKNTVKLLGMLMEKFKIPFERIIMHADIDGPGKNDGRPESVCPGKFFPYEKIIDELKKQAIIKDDK